MYYGADYILFHMLNIVFFIPLLHYEGEENKLARPYHELPVRMSWHRHHIRMAGDNVTGEGLWSAITSTKEGEQFLRELYRLQMYHDSAPAKEAINATDTVSNYERLAGDVDKDCKEQRLLRL